MDTILIKTIIHTLNGVEVKGKDNLDRLLGCINALESIVQAVEQPPAPPEQPAKPEKGDEDG